jgi:predicted amidohydrolase
MQVVGTKPFVAERKIPVASVQTIAHDLRDFEQCWPRICHAVEEAAARGARLIVVPEGTVPAYVIGTGDLDVATLERAFENVSRIARTYGATIVYGSAHVQDGHAYNTGTVVGPGGGVAGRAEKHLLWHFDERWFARGRSLEPIDTPLGRLGVLICADGRLPTLARALVERGAEILVVPTAWVTSGRDPDVLENVQADLMAAVRARENCVPLVAANKAGVELSAVAYCGKSAIIDARGDVLARAGQHDAETLFAEVVIGGDQRRAAAPLVWETDAVQGERRRCRFGITAESDERVLDDLARTAAFADVDVLIGAGRTDDASVSPERFGCGVALGEVVARSGLAFGRARNANVFDPGALAAARERGIDFFVWTIDEPLEERWQTAFARTRAAELRAYVVVVDAIATKRAFAVDPDGAVACGTFGDFRLAQFVYDRSRTEATLVAPRTDILAGLRSVQRIEHERRHDAALRRV